jgi:2,4-dienoyl-CoA reductase-like NADH-dependent reductase (Old Yellow Enzyme family)
MWQPPERIKHEVPRPRWPTAVEAARSMLFSPIRIGPLTARQRTWVPAMVPWRASEDGAVTPQVIDWYRRFAQGRPGVLVVEATGIRDIPSGPLLRIGHDRFIDGLRTLADVMREASRGETLLLIQVIDFLAIRRRPPRDKYFARYLVIADRHRDALAARAGDPSWRDPGARDEAAVRAALAAPDTTDLGDILTAREYEDLERGHRERVTDVHQAHIRDLPRVLPDAFARSAARAIRAGFDGVELHFAHAYTMASFLSALNDRSDGYGGPREQRVRLPLEVIDAVRAEIGAAHVVGCRFLGDDVIEGGNRVDDAAWFGVRFAAAGLDFLSVSTGGKFEDAKQPRIGWASYPYTGRSGYECMPTIYSDGRGPFGRNLHLPRAIRTAVRAAGHDTPVVGAGGICTFDQAEAALLRGDCDLIASARQALADPDWFLKMRLGRGAEIRRCEFTNYCEGLDQHHKQVTCKLWDRLRLHDPDVRLSSDGARRLVAPDWHPGEAERQAS